MNILCLMGLFPKEYENEILKNSLSGVQNAANKLQWAIVDGLNDQTNVKTDIINSLYIGAYPKKYKKALIPSFEFDFGGNEKGLNIGFLNLPFIKHISKYYSLKNEVDKWINSKSDEKKVIIAYAMTSPFVELLHYVKNKYPQINCILFVPDLPEYMDLANKSLVYKVLKKLHISHLKKYTEKIDAYVLLTDYMKEWFDKDIRYSVIEGIYKENQPIAEDNICKEKTVLYSGGLYEEYGVLELVEVFLKINEKDWKLELIGDGPLLPALKQISKSNNNCILIRGTLPNSEVLKRQKQVSILVNPRKAGQEFTKYSFPSKTIEYMASGTPMVGYRLPGIPDEYYKYIYEVTSDYNALETCLKRVMILSEQERNQFGFSAKGFIQKEKNATKQCNKIITLIESIN